MNLLSKKNSFSLFFLIIVFGSCVSNKIQIPPPDLTMTNKIQFDAESKEIWAYDFKGQEHYFSHSTKNIIQTFNSEAENINAQTIQLYCNYHASDEMLVIGEKKVSEENNFSLNNLSFLPSGAIFNYKNIQFKKY